MGKNKKLLNKNLMGCNRVTHRRRHPYNTKRNVVKKVRTPSGRLKVHYLKKTHRTLSAVPTCPLTKSHLNGVVSLRKKVRKSWNRKVSRAYGGHMSYKAVKERIIRSFLIEEQKIVKKLLKEKSKDFH